jgi:DnaK suppressor protein
MALNPQQTDQIRRDLTGRASTLEAELREGARRLREHNLGNLAGPSPDPGDASLADLIADLDNAELVRDVNELRDVQAALRRIDDGSYGVCVDCGRDIDGARLRAQPAAVRCIECQTAHERTFASPGAPTL